MSHDASRLDSLASLARIDRGTRPVTKLELSYMLNSLDKKRSLYIVYIYAPTDMEFAQEVIEECAAFPYGDHDDLVDSMTQAVMKFRQGGLIQHPEDYKDEPLQRTPKVYY
jgi:phage terminase large subunit-like protein